MMFLPKKVSWFMLMVFFIFDNVVSYVGITRMGGRELNAWLAPFVEPHPLLYFLCIPLEVVTIYIIMLVFREIVATALRRWRTIDKKVFEQIILTSIVIFWPIANSSGNLAFILGFRNFGYLWGTLILAGFIVGILYGIFSLNFVIKYSAKI